MDFRVGVERTGGSASCEIQELRAGYTIFLYMGAGAGKVYSSYAREDGGFASKFAQELEAHGSSVWMDTRIAVGQVWDQEIEVQLNACDQVVVILSPDSVKSQTVRDEISYAL